MKRFNQSTMKGNCYETPQNTCARSGRRVVVDCTCGIRCGNDQKRVNIHEFMKECDMDHDQMMSKAQMLKHMERMFDKVDVKKAGKLDKTQTESFLKQFNTIGGG